MARVYIETSGCSLNQSDSEVMAGLLQEEGHQITYNLEDADTIIFNTCNVKQATEHAFFNRLGKVEERHPGKKIIIAGCIPQSAPEKVSGYSLLGTHQLTQVSRVVAAAQNGRPLQLVEKTLSSRLNLPKLRKNSAIEIIPILSGCLGSCTYCIVPQTRGKLVSYDADAIIAQAESALQGGIREIWITSQDTGAYGKDCGSSLPALLQRLIDLPYDFRIRIGMTNPNHVQDMVPELIAIYRSEKMFKFLHLPVQSGNDRVLRKMWRAYTTGEYTHIVEEFRRAIPDITISTDMIAGFPTETDEEFLDSLRLIEQTRPDVLNISRFGPRPNTRAAAMEQVQGSVTKDRSRRMTALSRRISLENNRRWLGWRGSILIDEQGKGNTMVGRNFAYKPVVVEGSHPLGSMLDVEIKEATYYDLRGTRISGMPLQRP